MPSSPSITSPSQVESMAFDKDDELDKGNVTMENNDVMSLESMKVQMCKLILESKLESVFPNIIVVLCIYLFLLICNCSGFNIAIHKEGEQTHHESVTVERPDITNCRTRHSYVM